MIKIVNDKYIENVKAILKNGTSNVNTVQQIGMLELPNDAKPLVALIHGDCRQLESDVTYAQEYDPTKPDNEEIEELRNDTSSTVLEKLQKYLADWDNQNDYRYSFQLCASYQILEDEHGNVEYIELYKDTNAKTITQALQFARQWESELLERPSLYKQLDKPQRIVSVKPIYRILDTNSNLIAAGKLQNEKSQSSTWENQLHKNTTGY